jgi:hypothetical protein
MKVEHVENDSSKLKVYLQKSSLKKKVRQTKKQELSLKVNFQKTKKRQKGPTTLLGATTHAPLNHYFILKILLESC